MTPSLALLGKRRFLPLFATQFLGAFNDNLFKTAMVILVTYHIYSDPTQEASFNAIAGGVFILPFFAFSALAGQLADSNDKARIIRIVKTAEIAIMVFGAAGLLLSNIPLMLVALFAMGVHSTFFGPIKYAILPQHLEKDEVLGGTGLVEAGTYIAILLGTIVGGLIPAQVAAGAVLATAAIGRLVGGKVPPAPPEADAPCPRMDWHIVRASFTLVSATLHIPRLFLAILSISFFWAMGAVLAAQFPPLVKNVLQADEHVATAFLAIFSVGVGIGSVLINRLLAGRVLAKYSPVSAIVMGLFIVHLYWNVIHWPDILPGEQLMNLTQFIRIPQADWVMFDLFGMAVAGGMFVVPLYAFLTTTVSKSETARTVAANNIVNSGAMVIAAVLLFALVQMGVSVAETLLMVAVASLGAAWLAQKLHRACD
ncbi:MFS transporter [Allosphingosinicella indica]|uniref:Major Facilitator Superfamily protein n=1 Tax=Allosphingosinicella indica TaxID=941907 RepID=A0A1X7GZZ3_9SPHN|nr:MFS transporter [Allosphingosinicella indica]SMF77441.1 Major Facilitator Superfamily protein [Allosphingosinicella indica]